MYVNYIYIFDNFPHTHNYMDNEKNIQPIRKSCDEN